MTKEDIIRMAQEAGFDPHDMSDDFTCNLINIERFAELVRADEREACSRVCEDIYNDPKGNNGDDYYYTRPYLECAAAILARGETK